MTIDIINQRLNSYNIKTKQQQINAIKEISQEIALAGLARSGFFKHALFQGGTCLRINYHLPRFSEDLDFILNAPNSDFQWQPYLSAIKTEFLTFGLTLSVTDRSESPNTVKKAFLKEHSFGKLLKLQYQITPAHKQIIQIKLEVDTNPPAGSTIKIHYLDFPYPFPITAQDLPSLFAGKCHALLCRDFIKGRDWFDLTWYIQNKIQINYKFLENAFRQLGPYQNMKSYNKQWLLDVFREKIIALDWSSVSNDVRKFLNPDLSHSVDNWNTNLFLALIEQLGHYLE